MLAKIERLDDEVERAREEVRTGFGALERERRARERTKTVKSCSFSTSRWSTSPRFPARGPTIARWLEAHAQRPGAVGPVLDEQTGRWR